MVFDDNDIKIASDKPSQDIKKNLALQKAEQKYSQSAEYEAAQKWGGLVAAEFINDAQVNPLNEEADFEMTVQRRLLLSFTATIGFEQYADDVVSGMAQKSFLDALKKQDVQLFETAQDTGAFSFYYLAFRRGGDTVRRIGQTFAMLCSHDGDPIYQELGEALYCWFLSVVKEALTK